jgi:adenosylcobinamide kinase / adenosylcobinamide-phosphate guanylyltransferase
MSGRRRQGASPGHRDDAVFKGRVVLITGGARSGKSRHALALAETARKRGFIATAAPTDDEMRLRIARHRAERGERFDTVEETMDLAGAVRSLGSDHNIIVVDCLTVWLGNLAHHRGTGDPFPEVAAFLDILREPPCDLVIVTNEVGMGLVPGGELGRWFRDLAGQVNQAVAQIADRVILMVCGMPLAIKEEET